MTCYFEEGLVVLVKPRLDLPKENITLDEPIWLRKVSSTPDWFTNLLFVLPTLPATFILAIESTVWRVSLTLICLMLVVAAGVLSRLRGKREEKVEEVLSDRFEKLIEQDQQAYAARIDEMNAAVFYLSSALSDLSKPTLKTELPIVRKSILGMVRHLLGPNGGVQANLFTVESVDPPCLSAGKWGADGGTGQVSNRKFRPGDETYQNSINKLERFVYDIEELESEEVPNRKYRTYATYPVSTDEELFGILTIDAPNPGDITELDLQLLGFFAAILTTTYVVDKDALKIPRP